ncbi:MAG: M55 family metallopeptidase [Acidobacteriota bacterium]|nr:M55 family metallopeptidase [Acidobacteriota bacterium]
MLAVFDHNKQNGVMKMRFGLICLALLLFGVAVTVEAQVKKMKIHISSDMEGVVGAVTAEQLGPTGFEYQRFREFMTQEVNAAIEAAFEAGATEVVVSDSHGNGQNLLIEKLPKNIMLVRAFPRPLMMMQGIDETFAGVIFLGYHSSTTNPQGVRAHTISSARLADVRLNNISMSEGGINAAIAGYFNVPVIMISGDDAAVKEVTALLGDVEGAVVKRSYGFHSAITIMPEAAYALIREKVKKAIGRIKEFKPYKLKTPVQLDVRFKNYRPSEVLSYLSIVERTDAHSIRFMGKDIMIEVSKFIEFIMTYEPGLEP